MPDIEGSIKRSDLVQAVEAAIENAGDILTTAEKIALRTVAASTDKVARGTFWHNDCGCPLAQIGLSLGNDLPERSLGRFFFRFDAVTGGMLDHPTLLLKVVED